MTKPLEEMTVSELVKHFKETRMKLDEAAEVKTTIQKEYDFIRRAILPGKMEEQDINKLDIGDGIKVRLDTELFASIPAANKGAAYQYLRDNGMESLITETVNGSTLKATAKQILMEGGHLPEDLFKITTGNIVKFY
ncbi:hypothetical protein KAR91_33105 [Candidatus Pacearchaeota archaeon]|nr:hypothetical protein [Candidatus Pacearchaeota archaeon]